MSGYVRVLLALYFPVPMFTWGSIPHIPDIQASYIPQNCSASTKEYIQKVCLRLLLHTTNYAFGEEVRDEL